MKVLMISTNSLPASPAGPAYVAGAALKAGHTVEVYECLFAQDLNRELKSVIDRFEPDVVGVSIRLVHGYVLDETAEFYTRHLDLRKRVREVVECVRQSTRASIVLGGPGFNYYAEAWLNYLDLDYGIRGEADLSFPLYLELLERGGDISSVPGCAYRRNGEIIKVPRKPVEFLDETAFPAYELFDLERYAARGIYPSLLTKRGCAFRCSYCPYHSLEGPHYRTKSPGRVVDEIEHIQRIKKGCPVIFSENNFNVPRRHAESICREILARKLDVQWSTGDLRPMHITDDFCRLLKESGCTYVNLSIESGSERMLARMRRGYTVGDIRQAFSCLERSGIPYGASLMFGAPGEDPQSVAETLALVADNPVPSGIWVTIGICLWTHRQEILEEVRQSGQFHDDRELFEGVNYVSPDLPRAFMLDLIGSLRSKKEFSVQVNKAYAY